MAFVNRGDDLLNADRAKFLPAFLRKLFHILDRGLDLLSPLSGVGNEAGDGPTMPGDHNCLAALDRVEQFGQMGLCLGSRDFAQRRAVSPESGRVFGKLTGTARFHGEGALTNFIGQFK